MRPKKHVKSVGWHVLYAVEVTEEKREKDKTQMTMQQHISPPSREIITITIENTVQGKKSLHILWGSAN